MNKKIYKRDIFDEIIKYLDDEAVIVLNGARQVGKTYVLFYLKNYLENRGKKAHYMDLEDSRYLKILDRGVDSLLAHLTGEGFSQNERIFVLLDEIQYMENPSSFLKLVHDHHKNIKLVVSGSSSFDMKRKFKNSLVGRTVVFEIFPLSFKEYLDFKEYTFIREVPPTQKKEDELKALAREFVLFGAYPKIALTAGKEKKEKFLQQIIDTYVKKDIRDIANIKDIDKFNKLIEILASQSGNMLNINELANTCRISKQTVEHYLFILESTYILKLVKPFSQNIRSELFKTPKILFYDTGLLQQTWLKTIPGAVMGNIFETAIFSELVKRFGREWVFYWRTKDKKEIDFILRLKDRIIPIEVKSNFAAFSNKAVNYFCSHYQIADYKVVGLEGDKSKPQFVYLWESFDS